MPRPEALALRMGAEARGNDRGRALTPPRSTHARRRRPCRPWCRSKELTFKVASKEDGVFTITAKYLGGVIKVRAIVS